MKQIFATVLLMFAFQSAWAIDIHTAKDQGLVGEATSGYLAAVKSSPSAEVRALISEVNAKRKAQFERASSNAGATMQQVQHRFYQLAVQKTASGHYYQDSNGRWQTK